MQLLLGDKRILDSGGEKFALVRACTFNKLDVVQLLLNRPGAVVTNEALVSAYKYLNVNLLELLLNRQGVVVTNEALDAAQCIYPHEHCDDCERRTAMLMAYDPMQVWQLNILRNSLSTLWFEEAPKF